MAANATSRSVIDNLPEVKRKQVVDAILRGESLREVAKIVGCSHTVVQDYKRKTVMPALKTAQQVQSFHGFPETNAEALQQQASLTRDIIKASPFRDRLEKLHLRAEKAMDRAETAVRVVRDKDTGELVPVGPDVAAIAPIMNQAHKNLEMLGRVTGELENPAAQSNIAIQIVMPAFQQSTNPGGCVIDEAAGGATVNIALKR